MNTNAEKRLRPQGGVFVIAEAGVNHDGNVSRAKQLIDAAAEAKADAVKFQTWEPGEITGKFAFKVGYLKETTDTGESRYELSNRLALSRSAFKELKKYAEEQGILFLSTPDGFNSLSFLVDELDMPFIKIGSSEITHPQFLKAIGQTRRPVILSTGLSTLEEVESAIAAVQCGGDGALFLLHCTSEYPAPANEINLRAMCTLNNAFQLPVGLSDHSLGTEAAIAAVAMGAVVIEKHFTLDKAYPGPDHSSSLDPVELKSLVQSIRTTEMLLGDGVKRPSPSEKANINGIRRGIVACHPIIKGTILTANMLACKRPGGGIAPKYLESLVGRQITTDLKEDEPLLWEYISPAPPENH